MALKKVSFLKILAELLIVFIGVYGAFELNRYQQTKRDDQIRKNYFRSFKSELLQLTGNIRSVEDAINVRLSTFTEAMEKGEQPIPIPVNFYFNGPMLITKAGFNADVFVQLDAGLAPSLSGGYDNVQLVSKLVEDFNEICNDRLISNDPIRFYNNKGQLRPEFEWYEEGLRRLQAYMANLSKMINEGAMPAVDDLLKEFEQ